MNIVELSGTANTSGVLTVTAPDVQVGYIHKVVMDYQAGDAIADLVLSEDALVTQNILTKLNLGLADAVWYPRVTASNPADAADSAFPNHEKMAVTQPLKLSITASTVNISLIDGDATTITVDTAAAHNLLAGDTVTIAGTTNYNGTYTVATKVDADTFTIADTSHNFASQAAGTIVHGSTTYRFLVYMTDSADK
jgi:hypothetical protein